MKVGLIDVDSHHFPNLALMKLSAWHKKQGDEVEWWVGLKHYDRVYQSKVFDETYSKDIKHVVMADEIIKGGTGYDMHKDLPDEIEHIYPDYSLYGIEDTAYGFLTRGCPRGCPFCIVADKEGRMSHKVADLSEFWDGQKYIELLDPNFFACKDWGGAAEQLIESGAHINFSQGIDIRIMTEDKIEALKQMKIKRLHFAWDRMKDEDIVIEKMKMFKDITGMDRSKLVVYVLTNYESSHEEDLYRVLKIRKLGFDPYVMVYDKPHAPEITRKLMRWVNNKYIFWATNSFDEYEYLERGK